MYSVLPALVTRTVPTPVTDRAMTVTLGPPDAGEVAPADDALCGDEPHPDASNNAASGTAASTALDEASARNETGRRADRCFCKSGRMLCASSDAYAESLGSQPETIYYEW